MIKDIILPIGSRAINAYEAEPGCLIISPEGELALTVMWEGYELDHKTGAYLPLTGEKAFDVQWLEQFPGWQRHVSVVKMEGCDLLVQPEFLRQTPMGAHYKDQAPLDVGGLLFAEGGARVLAENAGECVSVNLLGGRFASIAAAPAVICAQQWELIVTYRERECARVNVSTKQISARRMAN